MSSDVTSAVLVCGCLFKIILLVNLGLGWRLQCLLPCWRPCCCTWEQFRLQLSCTPICCTTFSMPPMLFSTWRLWAEYWTGFQKTLTSWTTPYLWPYEAGVRAFSRYGLKKVFFFYFFFRNGGFSFGDIRGVFFFFGFCELQRETGPLLNCDCVLQLSFKDNLPEIKNSWEKSVFLWSYTSSYCLLSISNYFWFPIFLEQVFIIGHFVRETAKEWLICLSGTWNQTFGFRSYFLESLARCSWFHYLAKHFVLFALCIKHTYVQNSLFLF